MQCYSLTACRVKIDQTEPQKYQDNISKEIKDISTKLAVFVLMECWTCVV